MVLHGRVVAWLPVTVVAALVVGVTGCGKSGSEYQVAPVTGKVTFNGEPVPEGTVRFQPVSEAAGKAGITGKPATGSVGQDGTFTLSTYGEDDGAVIGKHRVLYMPKIVIAESYEDEPTPSAYAGLVPKTDEVEIAAGPNQIEIELVKKGAPAGKPESADKPQ